jgi:hypothetical protein
MAIDPIEGFSFIDGDTGTSPIVTVGARYAVLFDPNSLKRADGELTGLVIGFKNADSKYVVEKEFMPNEWMEVTGSETTITSTNEVVTFLASGNAGADLGVRYRIVVTGAGGEPTLTSAIIPAVYEVGITGTNGPRLIVAGASASTAYAYAATNLPLMWASTAASGRLATISAGVGTTPFTMSNTVAGAGPTDILGTNYSVLPAHADAGVISLVGVLSRLPVTITATPAAATASAAIITTTITLTPPIAGLASANYTNAGDTAKISGFGSSTISSVAVDGASPADGSSYILNITMSGNVVEPGVINLTAIDTAASGAAVTGAGYTIANFPVQIVNYTAPIALTTITVTGGLPANLTGKATTLLSAPGELPVALTGNADASIGTISITGYAVASTNVALAPTAPYGTVLLKTLVTVTAAPGYTFTGANAPGGTFTITSGGGDYDILTNTGSTLTLRQQTGGLTPD